MLANRKTLELICLLAATLGNAIFLDAEECGCGGCCGCDDEDDNPPNNTDEEDPSLFCCFFYKNANFEVVEESDKLVLCAMSTNYGLVPNAVSLPNHDSWSEFDNEMESYKCGQQVGAHVCGGVFTEEIMTDEQTGMQAMDYLCGEETLEMIEPGAQAANVSYGNEMSGVIINPRLLG